MTDILAVLLLLGVGGVAGFCGGAGFAVLVVRRIDARLAEWDAEASRKERTDV